MRTTLKIVYLVGLVAGVVLRTAGVAMARRSRRRAKPIVRRRAAFDWPLMVLIFLGMQVAPILYLATPWLGFADYGLPYAAELSAGAAGTLVFALALWLLWRSHADLGSHWSALVEITEGQELVTSGVYSRIRHPMYAAHWLWGLAQLLLLHNWIAGPSMLVVFAPFYLLRVRYEEELLLDHFGDDYRRYAARTGRILPKLGR